MQETDTPVPVGRSSAARTDPRGRSYGVELELSLVGGRIVATSVTLTAPEGVDTTLLRAFPLKEVVDEAIAAQAKLWARHPPSKSPRVGCVKGPSGRYGEPD